MGLARGARSLWKKSGIMLSVMMVGLSSGLLAATSLFSITAIIQLYQIRRPLGLVFVIYFWWLGELLLLYI